MASTLDFSKKTAYNGNREPQRVDEGPSAIMVHCDAIKNEFTCAICLGILKKTVTSQECLHRFCCECITTSLRIGNQECPNCRAKLTSNNLRADPVFDNIIEKLFPQPQTHQEYEAVSQQKIRQGNEESRQEEVPDTKAGPDQEQNVSSDKVSKIRNDFSLSECTKRKRGKASATRSCLNKDSDESSGIKKSTQKGQNDSAHQAVPKRKLKAENRSYTGTSIRKSLRIEAIKIESEKNCNEAEYNRRLSSGSTEVFFESLELRPSGLKNAIHVNESIHFEVSSLEKGDCVNENIPPKKVEKQEPIKDDPSPTLSLYEESTTKNYLAFENLNSNDNDDPKKVTIKEVKTENYLKASSRASGSSLSNTIDPVKELKTKSKTNGQLVNEKDIPVPLRRSKRAVVLAKAK